VGALLLAAIVLSAWAFHSVAAEPTTNAASRAASQPTTSTTSAPASQPTTTTAPAPPPLTAPSPDSLKAYDRHSDDGSTIIIEWAKPPEQAPGVWYVLEMAESEEDLADGKGKLWKVEPLKDALKSSLPKYFGFSKDNESRYFAALSPADVVTGAGARMLAVETLHLLAGGVLTRDEANEAIAALRDERPEAELDEDEKALREWASRLKAHLSVAVKLDPLAKERILTLGDVDVAKAALTNRKIDKALSSAQQADRKWLGRLKSQLPLVKEIRELLRAGLLSPADFARAVAAVRNRKVTKELNDVERADRTWLGRLSLHLKLTAALRKLVEIRKLAASRPADVDTRPALVLSKILGPQDVDRIKAALADGSAEDQLSDEAKADRAWIGRLNGYVPTLLMLGELVKKGVLDDEEIAFARATVRDRTLDDDLNEEGKAAHEWLGRLGTHMEMLLALSQYQEDQFIADAHVSRIISAIRDATPKARLSGQAKSDRRWLEQGISAHIAKKKAEKKKAKKAELNGKTWYFRLAVTDGKDTLYVSQAGRPVVVSAAAEADYFKWFKLNNLIFAVVFSAIVLVFIQMARRNPNLFIRKIAGLDAVEEAIGRATEMGRPAYFVHGLRPVSALGTIAAVNILARVARRAADYDSRICVMNNDPIVTAVSQEVVQQAYTEAGRPDAFNADDVSLVAADQFSYAAAVGGRMVRERPAAVFLMGYFFAESLLLAETGAATGAIQVAGTDAYTQLPFFITTCDYTLIGEELYAASAYLSREPRMLGSLRGQDVGKAFMMVMMVIATIIITIYAAAKADYSWIKSLLEAF